MNCLFCRIVAGEIPATIVHRDDEVVAFRDIAPKAPTHILFVPTRHFASLAEAQEFDPRASAQARRRRHGTRTSSLAQITARA